MADRRCIPSIGRQIPLRDQSVSQTGAARTPSLFRQNIVSPAAFRIPNLLSSCGPSDS